MAFTVKDWKDDPDHTTPLSAAALEDLEERLAAYGWLTARLATTAALAAYTRTTNKLEANANGALANIDSVAPAVNDLVLLKNGAAEKDNGLYKITSLGSAGTKWTMERAAEMNSTERIRSGQQIFVTEGTQNGKVLFALLTAGPITLNTTALEWGYGTAWVKPTFLNEWTQHSVEYGPVGYRKSLDGRVTIRGLVVREKAGSDEKPIFTLPEGFRPSGIRIFPAWGFWEADNRTGSVWIKPDGTVLPVFPSTPSSISALSLDCTFYAD